MRNRVASENGVQKVHTTLKINSWTNGFRSMKRSRLDPEIEERWQVHCYQQYRWLRREGMRPWSRWRVDMIWKWSKHEPRVILPILKPGVKEKLDTLQVQGWSKRKVWRLTDKNLIDQITRASNRQRARKVKGHSSNEVEAKNVAPSRRIHTGMETVTAPKRNWKREEQTPKAESYAPWGTR